MSISLKLVIPTGGLYPGNIRKTVQYVRLAGVDVHTGKESAGGRNNQHFVNRLLQKKRKLLPLLDNLIAALRYLKRIRDFSQKPEPSESEETKSKASISDTSPWIL